MSLLVDIRKNYGTFQLDVAFEVEGGITGLLGASGCGKSLTLKCIAGIERPDSGRIELDGRVLFDSARNIDLPPQKRRVGYLFQHYALFSNMTVEQNIAAGVRDRDRRREETARLMAAFQLEGCGGKLPRQLSGGQKQRVALARILASQPEALLLDEPFSALDGWLKNQVEQELAQRLESFSGPVLFVSHDRGEIARQCARVCVLADGRSQAIQTVRQLFDAPATRSACRLSGCRNLSRVRLGANGRLEALDWGVTLDCSAPLPAATAFVGIRAHHLRFAEGPGPNRMPCRVLRRMEGERSVTLLLATPGGDQGDALLYLEGERDCLPPESLSQELWVKLPAGVLLPLADA